VTLAVALAVTDAFAGGWPYESAAEAACGPQEPGLAHANRSDAGALLDVPLIGHVDVGPTESGRLGGRPRVALCTSRAHECFVATRRLGEGKPL
jgi:hypothetical protein